MKNNIILSLFLLFTIIANSQLISENKDYVLVDSVDLTKAEIYAKTKYFIADNWVSANNVIQLDDKETGIILIKGKYDLNYYSMSPYLNHYIFDYTIEFRMKDGKIKMSVKNIENNRSYFDGNGNAIGKLYLSYSSKINCPGILESNSTKKLVIENMIKLDKYFNSFLIEYKNALHKKADTFDDF